MSYALAAVEIANGILLSAGLMVAAWRLYREEYHRGHWYAVFFVLVVEFLAVGMLSSWLMGFPAVNLMRSLIQN